MQGSTQTAYRKLSSKPNTKEIHDIFTPTNEDVDFVKSMARKPVPCIRCLLHLKTFQHLGYFIKLADISTDAIQHLVDASSITPIKITKAELIKYDQSGSGARHIKDIRTYLGVSGYTKKHDRWLEKVALEAAETKHIVADIINVLLEELVRKELELPGFDKLKRVAANARKEVNDQCFASITDSLTSEHKSRINGLFEVAEGEAFSTWNIVKREPQKMSNKEVRSFITHIKWLEELRLSMPEFKLPPPKLKQFTVEVQALNASEMAALRPLKRYALACILIKHQHSHALDDIALQFVRLFGRIERRAQNDLTEYLLRQQKIVDHLVSKFKDVLEGYIENDETKAKIKAIKDAIDGEQEILFEHCEEHLAFAGNNYFPFMLKYYKQGRSILIDCLEALNIHSTSNDQLTIQLLKYLFSLRKRKSPHVRPEDIDDFIGRSIGDDWMSEKWRKQIISKGINGSKDVLYNRKYLELCIMSIVKQEFSSIDLYIPYSADYIDYREELANDKTVEEELPLYAEQVGLPLTDPHEFVSYFKQQLVELSKEVDQRFPDNTHAHIKEGKLSLRNADSKKKHPDFDIIQKELSKRIAPVSIVDALTDVTKWLNLDSFLMPLSGNERRIDKPTLRFVLSMFCYGCNFGPSEVERSVKGLSQRQLAWLNNKHTSLERLIRIDQEIINKYKLFKLPYFWGTGKSASADGTMWDLFEQNLMSEFHIRYGGYGGLGYYHVSDTYIALFSHFIQCGVYEGTYILDGLMKNESDVQPDTLHGDTHSQNFPVFALSYLLGIKLMPRIKNIKELNLYRPDKRYKYDHIDDLFDESINFRLIETHLMDMMKIVISIKKGMISPSTILRRLGSGSRKNKLYFAFRELGRAVRTMFLLEYIDEVEMRKMINAATNKSEVFNNFVKWLFFGNGGVISENLRPKQQLIVKYSQVVANMMTFYNVVKMEEVFDQLTKEGFVITPELLGDFSPYRQSTINRYGNYKVNDNKNLPPIDFNKTIVTEPGEPP